MKNQNISENIKTISHNTEIILPDDSLSKKLEFSKKENRPLVIKCGFDPTAPDLHLGHVVLLRKLKEFQDMGHKVVIIIGDFTAKIGDPTGKNKTRPPLSDKEIKANAKTYVNQLSKILNTRKIDLRYNSQWLKKMTLSDSIRLLSSYNLGKMLTRDDFKKRYENDTPIAMHELFYPLLQGYDSLKIKADIEIGGTDQLFNLQVGRHLQELSGLPSQTIVCMPLLRGLDGKNKMSKSLKNYIGITESPQEMYGKVMSMPDDLLSEWIKLISTFEENEKQELIKKVENANNPMELKKKLAFNIVEQFHSEKEASIADKFFFNQFQNKEKSNIEYQDFTLSEMGVSKSSAIDLSELLVILKVTKSKSAANSLIRQGAVSLDGEKITDYKYQVSFGEEILLKCGKKTFIRIKN